MSEEASRSNGARTGWRLADRVVLAILVLGGAELLVLACSLIAAALISTAMWGYAFARPRPDPRVYSVARVTSVTPLVFEARADAAGGGAAAGGAFVLDSAAAALSPANWSGNDYYLLNERILAELHWRGVNVFGLPANEAALAGLYERVCASGVLVRDSAGYAQTESMTGVAVEAVDANGRSWLLVSIQGGEVSNDHHPFYELMYDASGSELKLVSTRRFFYDVAGLEGFEFPAMFMGLAALGSALVACAAVCTAIACAAAAMRARAGRRGDGANRCLHCGYELTGVPVDADGVLTCPECGTGERAGAGRQLAAVVERRWISHAERGV